MTEVPPIACQQPGCPEVSDRSHCPAHRPPPRKAWKHRSGEGATKRGYDWAWRQLAKRLLRRHPVCQVCGDRLAVAVDHKVPLARGGTGEVSNLQTVCKPCHELKTARESEEGARERRRR